MRIGMMAVGLALLAVGWLLPGFVSNMLSGLRGWSVTDLSALPYFGEPLQWLQSIGTMGLGVMILGVLLAGMGAALPRRAAQTKLS